MSNSEELSKGDIKILRNRIAKEANALLSVCSKIAKIVNKGVEIPLPDEAQGYIYLASARIQEFIDDLSEQQPEQMGLIKYNPPKGGIK